MISGKQAATRLCGWLTFLLIASALGARAFPVSGDQAVLPAGTELNEEALEQPREIFNSEIHGGARSYLSKLGDLAFNSPSILGGIAARAGLSCGTCHVSGAGNPRLFVPGLSTRPGNFDTTGALFNAKADNGVLDPVTIPSLRGARYLAPYGHNGRTASLRDFVRDVIVGEFAGPEPAPGLLDALVAYIQDIDFLPNPWLGPAGRLVEGASAAAHRGEALFLKPFPQQPAMSCAGCHMPSAAFVDHLPHDVGSGGLYKTPSLLNADFNAPYFHDGRYDTYEQVVAHFDRVFALGLSPQDVRDLVAYLRVIGDGVRPYERDGIAARLREINQFGSVLDTAIPAHDRAVIALAVETVGGELRELTEAFPDRKDASVSGGKEERALARTMLKDQVLRLRRIAVAAEEDRFDAAAAEYESYAKLMAAAVPKALQAAESWSLFNPEIHAAHFTALRQLSEAGEKGRP